MARFLYQAKNSSGQMKMGQIDAIDDLDARNKIKNLGLIPVKVIGAAGGKGGSPSISGKKVSSKELQIFTRQFSTLINSGITVVDSLKMLSEGKRNPIIKDAAARVKSSIESGKRLAEAMAAIPNVFDRFYINMVRAGEEAGILDNILNRLAQYMEKSEKLKKQVTGALVYPAGIIFVAIIVIIGILVFVIPKFQELYEGADRELPLITQMVVGVSQTLIHRWYFVLLAAFGIPYAFMQWYRTPEGKDTCDRIFIKTPVFGELIQKAAIARMTRTLATLLSSGVSVIEALEIAAKTAGNSVIEEALVRSKESVTAGKPLAAPLAREPLIPDMVTQMISIGEQSGNLDTMLGKIADFYEDDVENAVKAMTSLIEPALMIILGSVIAVIVAAMYLPIFDMANITGG